MQLLADTLGLERILACKERLQHLDASFHEPPVREHAAVACDADVGMHCDDGVDRVFGLDLRRPAALGAFAEKGSCMH
jgi:hypothetical protein